MRRRAMARSLTWYAQLPQAAQALGCDAVHKLSLACMHMCAQAAELVPVAPGAMQAVSCHWLPAHRRVGRMSASTKTTSAAQPNPTLAGSARPAQTASLRPTTSAVSSGLCVVGLLTGQPWGVAAAGCPTS